jgi:hypothetical protein
LLFLSPTSVYRSKYCQQINALSLNIKFHFDRIVNQNRDEIIRQIKLPLAMPSHMINEAVGIEYRVITISTFLNDKSSGKSSKKYSSSSLSGNITASPLKARLRSRRRKTRRQYNDYEDDTEDEEDDEEIRYQENLNHAHDDDYEEDSDEEQKQRWNKRIKCNVIKKEEGEGISGKSDTKKSPQSITKIGESESVSPRKRGRPKNDSKDLQYRNSCSLLTISSPDYPDLYNELAEESSKKQRIAESTMELIHLHQSDSEKSQDEFGFNYDSDFPGEFTYSFFSSFFPSPWFGPLFLSFSS